MRVYDSAGNVIETHEHTGDFQRVVIGEPLPRQILLWREV